MRIPSGVLLSRLGVALELIGSDSSTVVQPCDHIASKPVSPPHADARRRDRFGLCCQSPELCKEPFSALREKVGTREHLPSPEVSLPAVVSELIAGNWMSVELLASSDE